MGSLRCPAALPGFSIVHDVLALLGMHDVLALETYQIRQLLEIVERYNLELETGEEP
jgi:hypothetical protein